MKLTTHIGLFFVVGVVDDDVVACWEENPEVVYEVEVILDIALNSTYEPISIVKKSFFFKKFSYCGFKTMPG